MKFSELSDEVKERVRDKWRETVFQDSCDWEHIYTDAQEIGGIIGLEIDDRHNRTVGGQKVATPDISFSGFWSQGDGACWTGRIRAKNMAGAVEKLTAHLGALPAQDQLHSIALHCERIHGMLTAYAIARRLDDSDNDPYPECHAGMNVSVTGKDHHGFVTNIDDSDVEPEIGKEMSALIENFAEWIYGQLESEHDHLCDDAAIDETIEANDYDFDEDTGAIL